MIENLENEEWLPIDGYENLYQVSNYGRIKSLERIDNNNHLVKEKILKQKTTKYGYQQVGICKDKKQKRFQVHRLVANAFIPNPNNYPVVNHKDEVKTNNHVDNLEWCTVEYNCNYGTRNEKVSKAVSGKNNYQFGKFGKEHHRSKQVIQLTLSNEVVKTWDSMMDIKRELGYNNAHISSCCKGKRKTSNGFIWRYVN